MCRAPVRASRTLGPNNPTQGRPIVVTLSYRLGNQGLESVSHLLVIRVLAFGRVRIQIQVLGTRGFFNLGTVDTPDQMTSCCGDPPMHRRMFSNIPDLSPRGARGVAGPPPHRVVATKNVSRHCQMSPGAGWRVKSPERGVTSPLFDHHRSDPRVRKWERWQAAPS